MVGRFVSLCTAKQSFSLTKTLPFSVKRGYCSDQGIDKERARTTAEEFKRVAEEKSRQGLSSQVVEKAADAAEEATVGTSQPQHVKEAYKESPQSGRDFKRRP